MDLAALLEPVLAFFRDGVGKTLFDVASALYRFLFPANAEAATKG